MLEWAGEMTAEQIATLPFASGLPDYQELADCQQVERFNRELPAELFYSVYRLKKTTLECFMASQK